MRAFTAVFLREIEEHRLVFVIGGFLALVACLVPILSLTNDSAQDVREATAMALALGFAVLLSLGLGLTGIASELSSGQEGFYFARPISALSLLSGKLAAALVLIAGGGLLAALPAARLFASPTPHLGAMSPSVVLARQSATTATVFAVAMGAILLVLGCAHFFSLALRARDGWLAVDLAWLATLAALGLWSHSQLESAFADSLWKWLLAPSLLLLIPAVLVSWWLQVERGRTDLTRSHRWMSAVLGCLVLAIGSSLAFAAHRASKPEPTDIWALETVGSGYGDWLYLKGATGPGFGDYRPSFFWNLEKDRFVRVHSTRSLTTTEDRSTAVWLQPSSPGARDSVLYSLDLTVDQPRPVMSPAIVRSSTRFLDLSPDGSRAALWDHRYLSVVDVASGVSVLNREINEGFLRDVSFRDLDTLQLLRRKQTGIQKQVLFIDEIDLDSSIVSSHSSSPLPHSSQLRWFAEGQKLITGSTLLDLSTGEVGVELAAGTSEEEKYYFHKFLSDGRIVEAASEVRTGVLRLYDRDGKMLRRFDLESTQDIVVGGQPSREELLVAIYARHDGPLTGSWTTYLLDLTDGARRSLVPLTPVSKPGDQPGASTTSLFTDDSGNLFKLEEDGSTTHLIHSKFRRTIRKRH